MPSTASASKKQRLSLHVHANDAEGHIIATNHDEDRKARAELTKIGFDPDEDINKKCRIGNTIFQYGVLSWLRRPRVGGIGIAVDDDIGSCFVTPLIYFSCAGNLKMCRYALSRGADGRIRDQDGWSPMYWAAVKGHLDVVAWLFHHGQGDGFFALSIALHHEHFEVAKWLILNGALASNDDGAVDNLIMRNDLNQAVDEYWMDDKRRTVLTWAQNTVAAHINVELFLTGTIMSASSFRRHPKNQYATRSNKRVNVSPSPLVIFKGKSGILELVAEYAGYPTAHELRICRELIDRLPVHRDTIFQIETDS